MPDILIKVRKRMKNYNKTQKNETHESFFANQDPEQLEEECALKEGTQLITELVEVSNKQADPDPVKDLYRIQQTINQKMQELESLNCQFYEKQEKLFLKTFINIMDRMSDQLQIYKQKYDNIDQEIQQQAQCVELRAKMRFYRDECLFLSAEVKKSEEDLAVLQRANWEKETTNKQLRAELLRELKKEHLYVCRRYSLESKLNSANAHTHKKQDSKKELSFQSGWEVNEKQEKNKRRTEPRARYSTGRMQQSYTIQIKTPGEVKGRKEQYHKKVCSTSVASRQRGQLDLQLNLVQPVLSARAGRAGRAGKRGFYNYS